MPVSRILDVSSRILILACSVAVLATACADPGIYTSPNYATKDGEPRLNRTFRLGVGDKLKITVFGEENLSSQVEINASGQVALPLIGEVPATGKTLSELRDTIARRLAEGYLKNPKVNVEVLNFRPIYIHGEVRSGGEFAFKNGLSFRDAIAIAGGYTYRAQQGYLLLVREGGQEQRLPLPSDLPVLPGDNIRIPERFF
ncbi:MAG: polysaccharide biosynthesis protein [Hyphomicrobium sp.]|nr:MAG: polysaccharide biosynthesis protein [Hyphomicrobium sp.]